LQEWSACLVLQHCVADVSKVLRRMQGQPLPASITKAIMTSLLHALKCVHAAGFIHRDVSPSNVLFDVSGGVRLSDFGQARRTSPSPAANGPATNENVVSQGSSTLHAAQQEEDTDAAMSPMVGTRWYRAPELLFGARRYSAAVDMWSVGCLFAEMLTGRALFPGTSDIDQICRIRDVLGSPTLENWPGAEALPDWGKLVFPPQQARPWGEVMTSQMDNVSAVELLDGLIKYDPTTRLTAAQALDVEYFKQQPLAAENGQVAALVESLVGKKSE
jgi:serine/threonine protein kinase